jgi:hypothetical protein
MHRRSRPSLLALVPSLLLPALMLPLLLLAGCGCDDDYDDGNVIVDNRTNTTVPEATLGFYLARFGDPFTGNLLAAPLPAGSAEHLGAWQADYYDAEADMELGDLITWFDVFVYADEDNFFDIY